MVCMVRNMVSCFSVGRFICSPLFLSKFSLNSLRHCFIFYWVNDPMIQWVNEQIYCQCLILVGSGSTVPHRIQVRNASSALKAMMTSLIPTSMSSHQNSTLCKRLPHFSQNQAAPSSSPF